MRRSRHTRKAITPMASTPSGTPTPAPTGIGSVDCDELVGGEVGEDEAEAEGEVEGMPLVTPVAAELAVVEDELGLSPNISDSGVNNAFPSLPHHPPLQHHDGSPLTAAPQ